MSDIVEKTLASFPKFLSEGLLGGSQSRPNKHDVPSAVRQLISTVHSARSKSDEDLIIKKEISFLQQRFSQPNQSNQQVRETYSRLMFCLTLGYDVSFVTIHTVKLAQQGTGLLKRLGYLLSCLLLHENHEMLILLINTIQKDLKSSNLLDNCMGLTAASQLLNSENIPMFLPLVLDKLKHQRELVRIKAAHCLYQFYQKAPSMVSHAQPNFQKALCDKDPGVIHGVVQIYIELAKMSPNDYVHLGSSFLGILNQIINRSFPALHEYHSVPLPWLQIQLLKVLAVLGADSDDLKTEMYPVLKEVIQRSTIKQHIAFAVLYECIQTIAKIGGDRELLAEASTCVAKFLGSSSHTLRYLGIKALTALVSVSPEYAVQHQIAVVECLDGEELATQRKTLELLCQMANQANVKAICSKLFEHLRRTDDGYFKTDMANKIAELAEKLSPDIRWYVETVNAVLAESKGNSSLADRLVDKLDTELRSTEDEEFEQFLAGSYLPYLENGNCPSSLLRLAVWVLGELKLGLTSFKPVRVVAALCAPLSGDDTEVGLKNLALSSLIKLTSRGVLETGIVQEWFKNQKHSFSLPQLQQKYQEVVRLVSQSDQSGKLSRFQNGNRRKQYDFTLSFLDDYVCASLETSGSPYRPLGIRMMTSTHDTENEDGYGALYEEIISPCKYGSPQSSQQADSFTVSNMSEGSDRTGDEGQTRYSGLKMSGVKRVWGREGYLGKDTGTDVVHTPMEKGQSGRNVSQKQQLAQALFEGISTTSDQQESSHNLDSQQNNRASSSKSGSEGSGGSSGETLPESYLPSDDTSGWRAYSAKHTTDCTSSQGSGELGDTKTQGDLSASSEARSDESRKLLEDKRHWTSETSDNVMMSSNSAMMSSNPAVMSSENVVSSIMTSSKFVDETANEETSPQSSQSERREIWLANEGSPHHVQCESIFNSELTDGDADSAGRSMYDGCTDEGVNKGAVTNKAVVVDNTESKNSEEPNKNSLYSEYYNSQS